MWVIVRHALVRGQRSRSETCGRGGLDERPTGGRRAAGMVVIASPNRKYPPEPDALALAVLVVESLDELTPDAIESAARRARK